MLARFRSHLTFANVVSLMALFVALSGGAYALTIPKNSVGAKQLKKNAVTGSKIKKGAVTSSKVKDSALLAKDFKAGQLPAGPRGASQPGAPGTRGAPGAPGEKGAPGDPAPASAHAYSLQMPAAKSGGITQVLFSTPLATLLAQCKDDAGSIVAKYQVIFLENHPIVVASDPSLVGEQFQTGTSSATLLSSPRNLDGTFKPEAHGLTYAVTGEVNADGQSCSFHASTVES